MGSGRERTEKAMDAMDRMGFHSNRSLPALKMLLEACEGGWDHIEADNYSLLIETILEADVPEEQDKVSKNREAVAEEEHTSHRKRLRQRQEEPLSLRNSMESAYYIRRRDDASASTSYLRESVEEDPEKDKSLKGPDQMPCPAPKSDENGEESKSGTQDGKSTKSFEIVCSTVGGKKVSLVCEVSNFPDFHMPEIEEVSGRVEERYPIRGHGFSLMDLMKEVGKSLLESMKNDPSPDSVDASGISRSLDGDDEVGASEEEAEGRDQELEVEEEAGAIEIPYLAEKQEHENDEVGDAREKLLDNNRGNQNCGDGGAGDARESLLGGDHGRRVSIRRKIPNHSSDFFYF